MNHVTNKKEISQSTTRLKIIITKAFHINVNKFPVSDEAGSISGRVNIRERQYSQPSCVFLLHINVDLYSVIVFARVWGGDVRVG